MISSFILSGIPFVSYFDNYDALAASASPSTAPVETYLLQFDSDISEMERAQVLADMNAVLIEWMAPIHVAKIQVQPTSGADGRAFAAAVNPAVHFVERDDAIVEGAYLPNDPDFADNAKTYAQETIHLAAAWDVSMGNADVIIAVLDTGLSLSHAELATRFVPGYDLMNGDDDPSDDHGHGTHVAGIIAAQMDNKVGTAGVCPNCRIMPVKVLDKQNLGSWSTVAEGIIYAVDHGAQIINVSLGGAKPSPTVEAAVEYAASKGVLIVAAAGNAHSTEPFYPAAYDHVLAVSATDKLDDLWPLSNSGDYIDVAAPGHMIYSTMPVELSNDVGYAYMTGTSMAAPHVAGLAGLLLSQDASRSAADLEAIITASADDLGEPGWDAAFGYGRINAYAALTYNGSDSQPPVAEAPPVRFEVKAQIYMPVVRVN
ncbi:MAG: S8 family peptidase [Caldilineaceae bacterium]